MELEDRRLMTVYPKKTVRSTGSGKYSCHHGDVKRQNNLSAARRVEKKYGRDIGIYEIDFLSNHGEIISSHDYNMQAINNGRRLGEWVQFVVIKCRKILWMDVKENYKFMMQCGFEQFDTAELFSTLKALREWHREKDKIDIRDYIWIGCQERSLHADIVRRNVLPKWSMILDMPTVMTYVLFEVTFHTLRGSSLLLERIHKEFQEYPNKNDYTIVTLDRTFFSSPKQMIEFIETLHLPPETTILVNSFDQSTPPLRLEGHNIITQYDYTCIDEDELDGQ